MVESQVLRMDDMSEIIALLKTFKGSRIGERLGFLQSLIAGTTVLTWSDVIRESSRETLSLRYAK